VEGVKEMQNLECRMQKAACSEVNGKWKMEKAIAGSKVQASLRDAPIEVSGFRGLKPTAIIESSLRDCAKLKTLTQP